MNTPSWKFLALALTDSPSLDRLRQSINQVSDWPLILALASRHDLIPQLHQAAQQLSDEVPALVSEQLRTLYATAVLHSLQLAQERYRITSLLLAAGIPVIPWKGPALAEQLYGDVTLRSCVDLDLLVPPERGWDALQQLQADGYSPDFAVPDWRWPSLRRTVNHLVLSRPDRNSMIELHWAFFHPMHGFPFDLSTHWQQLTTDGAAREGCLGAEELLVLLCAHGLQHGWEKLKWVADIDRLVRRTPELDWTKATAIADRMGSRRGLLLGLELAQAVCGAPLPEKLALLISRDPLVARLAAEVRSTWLADPAQRDVPREYLFHLRSRERVRDRLLWVLRQLFAPRQADWQLFPLGSRCYPLFYLERPLRMVRKWLIQPLLNRRLK